MNFFLNTVFILIVIGGAYFAFRGVRGNRLPVMIGGVAAMLVGAILFMNPFGCSNLSVMRKNTVLYNQAQGEYLGKYAAEHFAGKKVAVVVSSLDDETAKQMTAEFIAAFEKGFGGKVEKTVTAKFVQPGSRPPEEMTAEDLERSPKNAHPYNQAFDECEGCEVILNFAGLPNVLPTERAELKKISAIQSGTAVMLLPQNESNQVQYLREYIRDGAIAALVINRVDANKLAKDAVPEKIEDAFKARFLLVDKKNIEELAESANYKYLLNVEEDLNMRDRASAGGAE